MALIAALLSPPQRPPPVTATAIPAPPATGGAVPSACAADVRGETFATGTLEERVRAMRTWAAANPGRPGSLILTDAVLTEWTRQSASAQEAPLIDPQAAVTPDGIRVTGTAVAGVRPFQGVLRFPMRATLVPVVRDGALAFTVRDLDTGGLPGAFEGRVRELLAEASDPASWRVPLRIDDVVLRSGCAVIRGTARAT